MDAERLSTTPGNSAEYTEMRTHKYIDMDSCAEQSKAKYLSLAVRVQLLGHRGGGRGDAARQRLVVDARESNVFELGALRVDGTHEAERALEEYSVEQTCEGADSHRRWEKR